MTVQHVHCRRRRLLRRGLEFHVCTINKSAHTKKVWKLIVCTSYFHICHSLYQSFGNGTECTNYNGYYCHFHVSQIFQFSTNFRLFLFHFVFFHFYSDQLGQQNSQFDKFSPFFFCLFVCCLSLGVAVWPKLGCLYLKIPKTFVGLILYDG